MLTVIIRNNVYNFRAQTLSNDLPTKSFLGLREKETNKKTHPYRSFLARLI